MEKAKSTTLENGNAMKFECLKHPSKKVVLFCNSQTCLLPLCSDCSFSHISDHIFNKTPSSLISFDEFRLSCQQLVRNAEIQLENQLQDIRKANPIFSPSSSLQNIEIDRLKESKDHLILFIENFYKEIEQSYHLKSRPNEYILEETLLELNSLRKALDGENWSEAIENISRRDLIREISDLKYQNSRVPLQDITTQFQYQYKLNIDHSVLINGLKLQLEKYVSFSGTPEEKKGQTKMHNEPSFFANTEPIEANEAEKSIVKQDARTFSQREREGLNSKMKLLSLANPSSPKVIKEKVQNGKPEQRDPRLEKLKQIQKSLEAEPSYDENENLPSKRFHSQQDQEESNLEKKRPTFQDIMNKMNNLKNTQNPEPKPHQNDVLPEPNINKQLFKSPDNDQNQVFQNKNGELSFSAKKDSESKQPIDIAAFSFSGNSKDRDEEFETPDRLVSHIDSEENMNSLFYTFDDEQSIINSTPDQENYSILDPNDFKVRSKNYFNPDANRKWLYFFQWRSKELHFVNLETLKPDAQTVKFETINLNIDFVIPDYHSSIILPNGDIYLTGGHLPNDSKIKFKDIWMFNSEKRGLIHRAPMLTRRDSHSTCYANGVIYVIGGVCLDDDGRKVVTRGCEKYEVETNSWKKISDSILPLSSHSSCVFENKFIYCFGGKTGPERFSNHILRYSIDQDSWLCIKLKQNLKMKRDVMLASQSSCCQIGEDQIYVFGGYLLNKRATHQSFLFESMNNGNDENMMTDEAKLKREDFSVRCLNRRNVPFAAPFWEKQTIVHEGRLYCLQNVLTISDPRMSYNTTRRLLMFDGQKWTNLS